MRKELELAEKIEKYINGQLNDSERKDFELQMAASPELEAQVKAQQEIMEGIDRLILKQSAENAYAKYKQGRNFLRWGLTGLSIVFISGAMLYFNGMKKEYVEINNPSKIEGKIEVKNDVKSTSDSSTKIISTKEAELLKESATSVKLADIYKQLENPFQTFTILSNKDTVLTCREGTKISIKANSFVSEKTNKAINGNIKIQVKEFYKNSDIVFANLTTTSHKKLLETGGMFYIQAVSGGENCKLNKNNTIDIRFPYKTKKDGMQLFSGKRDSSQIIDWNLMDGGGRSAAVVAEVRSAIEQPPVFQGGEKAMNKFLINNLKYPAKAREQEVEGTVYTEFTIDENGSVTDPRIMRGISKECNSEALRVIKLMPKWTPARSGGKNVKVVYRIPVKFSMGGNGTQRISPEGFTDSLPFDNSSIAYNESGYNNQTIEESIKSLDYYSVNSYLFSTSMLGWINCDRFVYDKRAKTNFNVTTNASSNISTQLIFHSIKSIMPGHTFKNGCYFFDVPIGEKVTIVAFKTVDGKLMLAVKETTVSKEGEKDLPFEQVTLERLKFQMEKLNKLN